MFNTKMHLDRRTVLRGMGATIALPLLDAMVAAQTPLRKSKVRLAAIEIVHGSAGSTVEGVKKHYWSPVKDGADFEFTPSLKSLEPFRDYVTVVSNTDLANAAPVELAEEGGDHNRSSSVYLTGARCKRTEGSDLRAGTSIDQLYAQDFGQDTPLPSLQLCLENVGSLTGACGYGYSCVYSGTISWASPTMPLPMERDPRVVFESLFGDGGTPEERIARRQIDRSILDAITEKVTGLRGRLGASDRTRLSEYLDNVREIERRIQKIEAYNVNNPEMVLPGAPVGVPDSFEEHIRLMFDLQVLAFTADITRVSTFKLSRDSSSRVFAESGVKAPFHALSHHGEDSDTIAEYAKLNAYHVSMVPYFLEKLRATPDGDGTLLDNSMILYGSPMGNPNVHDHLRLPLFLAGHAGGQLKGNLHRMTPAGTPMANVLLTMMHKLGVNVESIGDSTGEVAI